MLVRRIRKRGANLVVEANAEVLFAASGDVGRWANRMSQRVRTFAAQEAPSNKRVRWAHYGKPLKSTMTASTTYQPGRFKVYAAVGSSAPHAYYVDQGTGVYAGKGPYQAKVLPPWTRGEGSLYEATWRPNGPQGKRVKPVFIKGQKGQQFMDAGLSRGMRSMRLRAFQVPGEGGPKIAAAVNSMPTGMEDFVGNTPVDAGFIAQLEEWRKWRNDAWARNTLGRQNRPERDTSRPSKPKEKPSKPSKPTKPKPPPKPGRSNMEKAVTAAKNEMRTYKMRHPQDRIAGYDSDGFIVIYGTGQQKKVYWSIRVADLFADAGVQHTAPSRNR